MKPYYEKHRAKILAKKQRYQQDNADYIKEYQRLYYLKNKEKKKASIKARRLYLKGTMTASQREAKAFKRWNKIKSNNYLKLRHNIRSLISMTLRGKSFKKESKTANLLGCSYELFYFHIESYFDSVINWDNYASVWQYDHICPCDQAQNEEELIKLQHYTNLRPYKDNLVKSNNKTPEGEQMCRQLLGREWRTI